MWVKREDHPLNRNRKKRDGYTGRAGKWYLRYDNVTPIVDDVRMLHGFPDEKMEGECWTEERPASPKRSRILPPLLEDKPKPTESAEPTRPRCVVCGSTSDFTETSDRDAVVCRCGTVCARSFVAQHRERNCTEDEDKTQHADRPREQVDPYSVPALSAEETRRQREREVKTTFMSKKMKDKLNIGWTQEHLDRQAASDRRKNSDMSSQEQSKIDKVRRSLEELFVRIEPVGNGIKAHCRYVAVHVWQRAVQHSRICSHAACQRNVRTLSANALAEAVLHCALQNLVHNEEEGLQNVPRSLILAANDKLAKNLPPANATQRVNRSRVDQLLKQPPEDACVACTPSSVTSPESVCSDNSVSLSRCDSELDNELMQLRDCITRVHRAMTSSPVVVHKGAMAAISSPGFVTRLTADPELKQLSMPTVAYAILQATDRLRGAGERTPEASLRKMLGLETAQARQAVDGVFRLLPEKLLVQIEQDEEDDLFD